MTRVVSQPTQPARSGVRRSADPRPEVSSGSPVAAIAGGNLSPSSSGESSQGCGLG